MIKRMNHEYKNNSDICIHGMMHTESMTATNVFEIIRNYIQYILTSNLMLLFEFIILLQIS